jgi:hypothetical protein
MNQSDETQFPAVDRLRVSMRTDLMRAARAHPRARLRFFRRRRVMAVVVVLLAVTPAALAGAGVFDSPDEVEYECAEAAKEHKGTEIEVGAPVEGPDAPKAVVHEKPGRPDDPCK